LSIFWGITPYVLTDCPQRNQHLRSADFLAAEQFPTIEFRSTGLRRKHGKAFDVTGDRTVRSWAERHEAEKAAWSAPGVTSVKNYITVRAAA
jgi:hypothetical protein